MSDEMTLRFAPIIFEPGDFFILDFFVLLSTSEPSSITSVGKIAGIRQIPVTISNLNRRSLFYDAYWGDWEVLLLRVVAAPVYILVFIACVVGFIWPVIFARSQLARRRVRKVLLDNGVDLQNPAARAIAQRVYNIGVEGIEPMVQSINKIMMQQRQSRQDVVPDILEILIRNKVLERNAKGEIEHVVDTDMPNMLGMHVSIEEITRADEKRMLASGILARENGELRVNEAALHALTVLAKSFGKNIPNIGSAEAVTEQVKGDSAVNVRTEIAEPPRPS